MRVMAQNSGTSFWGRRVVQVFALVLVAVLVAFFSTPAHADPLKITRVYDLKAQVQKELRDDDGTVSRPAAVTLTWRVDTEDAQAAFGDRQVTIRRGHDRNNVWRAPVVHTIPGPSTEVKNHVMTWTDENVRPGDTYFYQVESGRLNPLRSDTVGAVIPSTDTPSEEAGVNPDDRRQGYVQNVGWPERLAASLIAAVPNWLVNVLGLSDPVDLVFMIDTRAPLQDGLPQQHDLPYWHVFTESEMQAVSVFYDSLTKFVPIWLVVAVVLLALGILYNAANPQSKVGFREYLLGFALSMVLLKFGAQLLGFIFKINYALVQQFFYIAQPFFNQAGVTTQGTFLELAILADDEITLGDALIAFIAALCIGVLNFQYIMRKINIALLVGLLPIVAVVSIAPAKRYTIGIWFRELIANIFLQSAHAAVLAFLLLIFYAAEQNHQAGLLISQAFWIKLAALLGLAGMAGLVRSVIGAETVGSGPMGTAGAMFGITGLLALGKMLGKPGGAAIAGAAGAGAAGAGAAGAAAATAGVAGTASRLAAGFGKFGIAATGALAGGMIMGAATENPTAGIGMGAALGAHGADRLIGTPGRPGGEDPAGQASRQVFGRNIFAQGAMAGLQERSLGLSRPGYEAAAAEARAHVSRAQQDLLAAKTSLAEYKSTYDHARAKYTEAKNLYGPNAAHLERLRNESLPAAQERLGDAQQQYLALRNVSEGSRGADYAQKLEAAQKEAKAAQAQVDEIIEEINKAPQVYQESLMTYQAAGAEYARREQAAAQAERALTRSALAEEFTKIKERTARTHGGINGPRWS